MVYYLDAEKITPINTKLEKDYHYSFYNEIPDSLIEDFNDIQDLALKEIKEPISKLDKSKILKSEISVLLNNNLQFIFLFYLEELVGYAYSHNASKTSRTDVSKNLLNTIFVKEGHRGKKMSKKLIYELMNHNINMIKKLKQFYAITQEDNSIMRHILESIGFKTKQ